MLGGLVPRSGLRLVRGEGEREGLIRRDWQEGGYNQDMK